MKIEHINKLNTVITSTCNSDVAILPIVMSNTQNYSVLDYAGWMSMYDCRTHHASVINSGTLGSLNKNLAKRLLYKWSLAINQRKIKLSFGDIGHSDLIDCVLDTAFKTAFKEWYLLIRSLDDARLICNMFDDNTSNIPSNVHIRTNFASVGHTVLREINLALSGSDIMDVNFYPSLRDDIRTVIGIPNTNVNTSYFSCINLYNLGSSPLI